MPKEITGIVYEKADFIYDQYHKQRYKFLNHIP